MAPEAEKKRKRATGEPEPMQAGTQNLRAGEILRQARLEKKVPLEEISSAIYVRVGQLKAIEDDHLDSLPGMTYAVGFVKSYANYLNLDAEELASRFRAQHGAVKPKAMMPAQEPLMESKTPNTGILMTAAAAVLVLVVGWAMFTGGDEVSENVVSAIPPAPVIADDGTMPMPAVADAATEAETAPVADAGQPVAAPEPTVVVAPVPAAKSDNTAAATAVPAAAAARTAPAIQWNTAPSAGASDEVINVKPSKSRVVLKATQTTWVQITDAKGGIVLKKVLKPGEQFSVPEGTSYSLVTTNAGGVSLSVDGGRALQLGQKGDIVRGVRLTPEFIKEKQSTYKFRSNPFKQKR